MRKGKFLAMTAALIGIAASTKEQKAQVAEPKVENAKTPPQGPLATFQPQPGQFVWVYDVNADKLRKVDATDYETPDPKKPQAKRMVIVKGCIYVSAINRKNAARKVVLIIRSNFSKAASQN